MTNEKESKKYIMQECQDEAINKKFGELHLKLVNEVEDNEKQTLFNNKV